MQPDQPNSGLAAFLFGIVVLVLVAVMLAGLVGKRMGSSANITELRREVEGNDRELERLRAHHEKTSLELAALPPNKQETYDDLQRLSLAIEDQQSRIDDLKRQSATLLEEIDQQQLQFFTYRKSFVSNTRSSAVGKSLGDLQTRSGRVYRKAVIVAVTEIGLEIRHMDGSARIQASDLNDHMQELYQWNILGRRGGPGEGRGNGTGSILPTPLRQ